MATTTWPTRTPPATTTAGWAVIGAGLVVFGLLVAVQPFAAVGFVLAGIGLGLSISAPTLLAFTGIVALSLVPTYAAPQMGPIILYPAVLAGWGAAIGGFVSALARRDNLSFTVVDGAVGLMLLANLISVYVDARLPTDFAGTAWKTLGPYLGMRMIAPRLHWDWVPRAFAVATLAALPFIVFEGATQTNPFTAFAINSGEASVWAPLQYRFGTLRAEGAFGHAISLSQFVGTAILLALGAAVLAARNGQRRFYFATMAAGAMMLALSFSRTGWLVVAFGIVLIALGVMEGRTRARLLGTLAAIGVVGFLCLVGAGLLDTVLRLVNDDSLNNSNNFREILLRRALNGEGIAFWGLQNSPLGFGIDEGGGSVDNAWLAVAADWGWAGMGALALVGVSVAQVLWRLRSTAWALVPAVTLANFLGLFYVAINSQTQFWLWMLVGACSGALVAASAASVDRGP